MNQVFLSEHSMLESRFLVNIQCLYQVYDLSEWRRRDLMVRRWGWLWVRKKQRGGTVGEAIQKAWARVGFDIVLGLVWDFGYLVGFNDIWKGFGELCNGLDVNGLRDMGIGLCSVLDVGFKNWTTMIIIIIIICIIYNNNNTTTDTYNII